VKCFGLNAVVFSASLEEGESMPAVSAVPKKQRSQQRNKADLDGDPTPVGNWKEGSKITSL
jgi:hypothetical protein